MPAVSSSELARLRGDLDGAFTGGTVAMSIRRSPAVSAGGKFGAPVEVASSVPFKLWPAGEITMPAVAQALGDLDGARVAHIGACRIGVGIAQGDEVHDGAGNIYNAVRIGTWNATTFVALEQISPRPA